MNQEETANETIAKAYSQDWGQPQQQPRHTQITDNGAENTLQLYQQVLVNSGPGHDGNFSKALKDFVATGYLDKDELIAIRRMNSVIQQGKSLFKKIQRNLDKEHKKKIDMNYLENDLLQRIFFLCYSSKSKDGFCVRELNTSREYSRQNIYSEHEESAAERGTLDKLQDKFNKFQQGKDTPKLPKKDADEIWQRG